MARRRIGGTSRGLGRPRRSRHRRAARRSGGLRRPSHRRRELVRTHRARIPERRTRTAATRRRRARGRPVPRCLATPRRGLSHLLRSQASRREPRTTYGNRSALISDRDKRPAEGWKQGPCEDAQSSRNYLRVVAREGSGGSDPDLFLRLFTGVRGRGVLRRLPLFRDLSYGAREEAMNTLIFVSLLAVVVLAIVHLLAGSMRFLESTPRSIWLSIAGGISVAYVFVHLLPDVAEEQQAIREAVGQTFSFLEY